MFGFKTSGSFKNTYKFLDVLESGKMYSDVGRYAQSGVDALSNATPVESGETAHSWHVNVENTKHGIIVIWSNSHTNEGVNVAILIQYGHGTGTGGYIPGRDYINPAIRPIFDKITNDVWEKVRNG